MSFGESGDLLLGCFSLFLVLLLKAFELFGQFLILLVGILNLFLVLLLYFLNQYCTRIVTFLDNIFNGITEVCTKCKWNRDNLVCYVSYEKVFFLMPNPIDPCCCQIGQRLDNGNVIKLFNSTATTSDNGDKVIILTVSAAYTELGNWQS